MITNQAIRNWSRHLTEIGIVVALTAVLFTVCSVDSSLWKGIITGKYFWFTTTVSISVIIWAITMFRMLHKPIVRCRFADIWILLFVVYTCINFFLLNAWPNMHWWLWILMIPLYVIIRTASENPQIMRWILNAILTVILVESVWGLLQLYNYSYSYHSLYKITGSLFNPGPYAGFIAVGMPLAISNTLNHSISKWERWLGTTALIAIVLVLPATASRAAWLAAIAGSALILWKQWIMSNKQVDILSGNSHKFYHWFTKYWKRRSIRAIAIIIICIISIGLLAGLYFLKKDSADGRWLIWRVSMEAAKEHPLFGTGYGTFSSIYGDAQASYFFSGKGSEAQAMVADSPEYAFNEYVQIAVELGLVGLVLFLMVIISCSKRLLYSNMNDHRLLPTVRYNHQLLAVNCQLITLLVFAAFSYPFSMLPLGILFVFLLAMSASSSPQLTFSLPTWIRFAGIAICIVITIYGSYQIIPKRMAYREWQSIQTYYQMGVYTNTVNDYQRLYSQLYYEKQFLFEYGQCLSKMEQYTESNRIFQQFLHYGSDPMIYNCMGNNFKALDQYSEAEAAYIHASQMVPNRHYPLYLLMKLYDESGQRAKAKQMAETLLSKPVKVPSTAIREMQEEAKKLINSNDGDNR